jgi:hypothetical protein
MCVVINLYTCTRAHIDIGRGTLLISSNAPWRWYARAYNPMKVTCSLLVVGHVYASLSVPWDFGDMHFGGMHQLPESNLAHDTTW